MSMSLFQNFSGIDSEYLDAAYADDAETAAIVFEQYLSDLPGNLEILKESIRNQDVEKFQHHIHKQKPGFSYVGLTDVTQKIQELQVKVTSKEDMSRLQPEIDGMVARIEGSSDVIRKILSSLTGH
jgi:hypothetical protein